MPPPEVLEQEDQKLGTLIGVLDMIGQGYQDRDWDLGSGVRELMEQNSLDSSSDEEVELMEAVKLPTEEETKEEQFAEVKRAFMAKRGNRQGANVGDSRGIDDIDQCCKKVLKKHTQLM